MDGKDKLIESYKRAMRHNKLWLVYNLGMDEGKQFWNPSCAYHSEAFARLKCQELNALAKERTDDLHSAQWLFQEIDLMAD